MLQISESQRVELERWAQSRSLSAADVLHARLILALAEGLSYSDIIAAFQTTATTIIRWKKRFEVLGLDGLEAKHKGSRPRVALPAVTDKIASLVDQGPSYRKIAKELALTKSTIQRICAQNHSKSHRLDRYMARLGCAPQDKPSSIIGLYLKGPQHVAAFSVNQGSWGPGVQSLGAALNSGARSSFQEPRHTFRQFTLFRDTLIARFRVHPQIHLVLDNPSAHKTMDVELFVAAHPHVHLHFLQSHKIWVEHVNLWLSEVPTGSDSGTFNIRKYLRAYAKSAESFWWILDERQ